MKAPIAGFFFPIPSMQWGNGWLVGNRTICLTLFLDLFMVFLAKGQEVRFLLKPNEFDLAQAHSMVRGPAGKFYALANGGREIKIALVRIDSSRGLNPKPTGLSVEKVLILNDLLIQSRFNQAELLCSSSDGRWIGCVIDISGKKGNLSRVMLIDFLSGSIRFSTYAKTMSPMIAAAFRDRKFLYLETKLGSNYQEKLSSSDKIDKSIVWNSFNLRTNTSSQLTPENSKDLLLHSMISPINKVAGLCKLPLSDASLRQVGDSLEILNNTGEPWKKCPFKYFEVSKLPNYSSIRIYNNTFSPESHEIPTKIAIPDHQHKLYEEDSTWNYSSFLLNDSTIFYRSYKQEGMIFSHAFRIENLKTKRIEFQFGLAEGASPFTHHKDYLFSVYGRSVGYSLISGNKSLLFDFPSRKFLKMNNRLSDKDQLISPLRTSKNFIFSVTDTGRMGKLFARWYRINGRKFLYSASRYRDYSVASDSISVEMRVDISKDQQILYMGGFGVQARGRSGKALWKTYLPTSQCHKLSEDQKTLAVCMEDLSLNLLNAQTGTKYLSAYLDTATQDWVLFTPSGYYDCSVGGEKLIGWSVGRGQDSLPAFYPASRFRERFYRPDVIDSALKYCSEETALKKIGLLGGKKVQKQMVQNLPPIIQITSPGMNEMFSDTLVRLQYVLKNGTSAVHTLKVLVDGRPWLETKPERSGSLSVVLPPHNCSVGLVAVSSSGESALSYSRLIWNGKKPEADPFRKANLYILAIGISKYKLERLRLNYAAKDARDFTGVLQKQAGNGLYRGVEVRLLTDSTATRENIEDGLDWLQKQTTSRDVAMIYLAGHGENDENNRFFFLPWGGDFDRKLSTCIPHTTFKSAIEALPGKVVVFADACRSGNFFGDLTRREVDVDQLSRELSSGNGGAVVFTSSSRKQASHENPMWNNGAFTKALVEGLEGKADPFQQNYISVQSLSAYISHRVNELTTGLQKPNIIIPESMPDFAIALKR